MLENRKIEPSFNQQNYIAAFMQRYASKINYSATTLYQSHSSVALRAYQQIVSERLTKATDYFVQQHYDDQFLERYLLGTLKWTYRQMRLQGKQTCLVCPGCKSRQDISFLLEVSEGLVCEACSLNLNSTNEPQVKKMYAAFAEHTRKGYRCPSCSRFMPQNQQELTVDCPYPNCDFSGNLADLQVMTHPVIHANGWNYSETNPKTAHKDNFIVGPKEINYLVSSDEAQQLKVLITETIQEQIATLSYKGTPATRMVRQCIYQAFLAALEQDPDLMIEYLSQTQRNNKQAGIQVKVFQEFTKILEQTLPYSYEQQGEKVQITSLLDPHLSIFDGESIFRTRIEHQTIRNNTQEIWSGKSGLKQMPYYLGKVLEIKNLSTDDNLLPLVQEYNCQEIKLNTDLLDLQEVEVRHLRIIPHYCSGAFVYIQRLKKKIVEKVLARKQ